MSLKQYLSLGIAAFSALAAGVVPVEAARAELVLSQLVVDLSRSKSARQDIEVWNNGPETAYVAVEPREVIKAGTPGESRIEVPEPEALGLLVAPAKMVLEPGQRKLLRIAAIGNETERERIYRVTVKPVVGPLSPDQAGLKILVGYDVLVLVRPNAPVVRVTGSRTGNELILSNTGNVSVELSEGQQCDASGKCEPLPAGRLYAGAQKRVPISQGRRARYTLKMAGKHLVQDF